MTSAVYKDQANRLAEHLSRVHGVKLKQASMLEAIANLHGRPDWNTLLAVGPADAGSPVAVSSRKLGPTRFSAHAPLEQLQRWLRDALEADASSLDLRPSADGYDVFMRIDGVRRRCHAGSLAEFDALHSALYKLAGLEMKTECQAASLEPGGEFGDLSVNIAAAPIDKLWRPHIFLRWSAAQPRYSSLAELGLSALHDWNYGLFQPSGLCLVAGGTGSGRTSTIVASARALAAEGRRVVLLSKEIDPRWIPGATVERDSRDVGDVILVDELRDEYNATHAREMASYGMLVIAPIHARDTQGALTRLRSWGLRDTALDSDLNVVMAQQLVRRVCSNCKGEGCSSCDKGQQGRIALTEAIIATPGRPITRPIGGKAESILTLRHDGVKKHRQGLVHKDELTRVFGMDIVGSDD